MGRKWIDQFLSKTFHKNYMNEDHHKKINNLLYTKSKWYWKKSTKWDQIPSIIVHINSFHNNVPYPNKKFVFLNCYFIPFIIVWFPSIFNTTFIICSFIKSFHHFSSNIILNDKKKQRWKNFLVSRIPILKVITKRWDSWNL